MLLKLALFVATGLSRTALVSAGVFGVLFGDVVLAFMATSALKDVDPASSQQALSLPRASDSSATGLLLPPFAVDCGIVQ